MNDTVIQFFRIIEILVKDFDQGDLRWRMEYFDRALRGGNATNDIMMMAQEIELCRRRKRSRRYQYNMSEIDFALNAYSISGHSEATLQNAWHLYRSGRYRI